MAPSNVTIDILDNPNEAFAEEAAEVFAGLMAKGPSAIALTGGDLSLIPDLGRTMIRSLVLTPGVSRTFTARDETGALVGYTIFVLPGQQMLSTEEQMKNGNVFEFMAKLSPEGQAYHAEAMGKEVPAASDAAFGIEDSERNTFWCSFAMVRRDYQGKGIAKALFQLAFKEAAKSGTVVALTTTNIRNVPIYKKIGFKYCGEKKMLSPWIEWTLLFFMKETKSLGLESSAESGIEVSSEGCVGR